VSKKKDFGRKSFFYYALMAFGVYAAASVSYTTNGSVSFTVSDVFVQANSKLIATIGGTKQSEENGATNVLSYETSNDEKSVKSFKDWGTSANKDFGAKAFTKTGDNIVVTVQLKNMGKSAIVAKFTVSTPNSTDLTCELKSEIVADKGTYNEGSLEAYTSGTEVSLESGAEVYIVLTITLNNMETTVEASSWSIVGKAAIDSTELAK
jgi:hypothetical protein